MAGDRIDFNLETDLRGSVPHFKTGQHRAWVDEERSVAVLVYVDAMGWAVALPCEREAEEWRPIGLAVRQSCTNMTTGWRELKPSFELSDQMRAALDAAEVVPDGEVLKQSGLGVTIFEESP